MSESPASFAPGAKLSAAANRLQEALALLRGSAEARISRCLVAERKNTEIPVMRTEQQRLTARIAQLEEEARHLAGITGQVEDRLDAAIAEIRGVLRN